MPLRITSDCNPRHQRAPQNPNVYWIREKILAVLLPMDNIAN